jgi:hypothetical protein
MKLINKLKTLSLRRSALLMVALAVLAVTSLALKLVHFKRIAAWLNRRRHRGLPSSDLALADDIGWAVRVAARRVPFRALCLEQALAAALLTNHLRLPATLYLGVASGADGGLDAHAWLSVQSRIITGASGHHRFRVIATFAP